MPWYQDDHYGLADGRASDQAGAIVVEDCSHDAGILPGPSV
jgi:hypothetical protein